VIVDKTAFNKTAINKKGPAAAVIEKASGRKLQAVPVRDLRNKEEAKVIAKRPTPTSTAEKAAQTPVRSQVEKPAVTTAEPQPSATKNEVQQSEQNRIAKLDEEKRVQQETARTTESEKKQSVPAAVEAKPEATHETKPEAKVESKPAVERPAATREPTEPKAEKDDEKKD